MALNVRANTYLTSTGAGWGSTGSAVDGAHGSTPNTFAQWISTVANGVGTIELGFGTLLSTGIAAGSTITNITLSVSHWPSQSPSIASVTMSLFDGATQIGTPQSATLGNNVHVDTFTFTPTVAQVRSSTFKAVMTITRYNGANQTTYYIDHIDAAVTYSSPSTEARFGSAQLDTSVTGMNPDMRFGSAQLDVAVSPNSAMRFGSVQLDVAITMPPTEARVGGLQADIAYLPLSPDMRAGSLQVDVAYIYGGPAVTGPTVTVWNGTSEIAASIKVWNGTAEIATTLEVT